ncbi:MAG: VOC family protein [Methanotrichaceae archaeon]
MISWFEIPADDLQRARKFYSELFGWSIEESKASSLNDRLIIKTGNGNAISGSLTKRQRPGQTIVNYIDVSSTDRYIVKIQHLGGKVLVPKTAVPGMGYFVVCEDTEENAFGIWENDLSAT